MKRTILYFVLLNLLLSNKCKNNEYDAMEVWKKHLSTIGNENVIKDIKTVYSIETWNSKYGQRKIVSTIKYPDKLYREVIFQGDTTKYILNGVSGIISGKETRQMNELELIDYKEIATIFPDYYIKQDNLKLLGIEKENNKEYFEFEVKLKPDFKMKYLIDTTNYELYKMISENADNSFDIEILEKEKISGINTRMKSRMMIGKDTIFYTNNLTKYNIEIDNSIFKIE